MVISRQRTLPYFAARLPQGSNNTVSEERACCFGTEPKRSPPYAGAGERGRCSKTTPVTFPVGTIPPGSMLRNLGPCLFADLTAVALPFAIMNDDVALCFLASCRTRRVRAKLLRRVHRLCQCLHMLQYANGCLFFQPLLPFSPHSGVLPSCSVGTHLFCPYYPFKSPSSCFGNAINSHETHAFERKRCPFWERLYFPSTIVVEEK